MRIQEVSAQQLNQWLANNEAVLVDVREPAEFATAHIQQASLLPVGQIADDDLPDTDKKVVIYCQKGVRGNSACIKVTSQNNERLVYNLKGGIAAWQSIGLPVIKGASNKLPLDRQVQLIMGTGVIAGSAATFWLNPAYAAVPAIFGASLLSASLTGSCALTVVVAKMPWNKR